MGYVGLETLSPLNNRKVEELCSSARKVIVAEVNNGQIIGEVGKNKHIK